MKFSVFSNILYFFLPCTGAIVNLHFFYFISFQICFVQGVDLRHYSKNVEAELLEVENASIHDCILFCLNSVFFL